MNLRERAMAVTPGGAQTRSKRATAFPVGYPQFLEAGRGARVRDEHGKSYIDWICGLGAISLGYRHTAVDVAAARQMERGVSFSLPTALEVEVAEDLRKMLPAADMVRFCKTGSEANEGACRIARVATGRDHIISIGYHGWHTMQDAALRKPIGVPNLVEQVVHGFPMHDPHLPFEYINESYGAVAGVIVEVMRDDPPPAGYVESLRQQCDREGALLIFDEMVTGFRWAIGGAGEFFGVTPDLATFGKGMANGWPLAAIVGRGHLMEHASYVSGTFGGETVSLAACQATLEVYRRAPVIQEMWSTGLALMAGFNALAKDHGLRMEGYAVHPRIVGERRDAFIGAVASHGILFHPSGFNVSLAHRAAEVDETLAACRRALESL